MRKKVTTARVYTFLLNEKRPNGLFTTSVRGYAAHVDSSDTRIRVSTIGIRIFCQTKLGELGVKDVTSRQLLMNCLIPTRETNYELQLFSIQNRDSDGCRSWSVPCPAYGADDESDAMTLTMLTLDAEHEIFDLLGIKCGLAKWCA